MIKESELKAPRGKIIIRQLKSVEYEVDDIIIPTERSMHSKSAVVISVGDMFDDNFYNDNDNSCKRKNILKKGDIVNLRFISVDRYEALGPDDKIYIYSTINPSTALVILKQ